MAATTSIEWTATVHPDGSVTPGRSWNPVTGCRKVSPGCKHCYAEGVAHRFWGTQYPAVPVGPSLPDGGPTAWRERQFTDVMTHEDRLLEPLSWKKPARVFVNSMSDLFHDDVPDDFIDQVFAVMALAPRHTFQVLTKRPDRMRAYLAAPIMASVRIAEAAKRLHTKVRPFALPSEDVFDARRVALGQQWIIPTDRSWPLKNVWLGVSVEDQERADERIPLLLQTPAAVRFISAEPLLGAVSFRNRWLGQTADCDSCQVINVRVDEDGCCQGCGSDATLRYGLDWVIVGGESGPGARLCNVEWIRGIVQQCDAAGVPVFVKQLGAAPLDWGTVEPTGRFRTHPETGNRQLELKGPRLKDRKGGDPSEWPEDLRVREFPQ